MKEQKINENEAEDGPFKKHFYGQWSLRTSRIQTWIVKVEGEHTDH